MHMWWSPPGVSEVLYEGDTEHRDYLTIPGGKIANLYDAFVVEYGKEPRGIDVVLVAGLNDVAREYSREYIMYCIRQLREAVDRQADAYHPQVRNTFAVATLLYPPQLAWFLDNGPIPYQGYVNYREKIDFLNQEIMRNNYENGINFAPKIHTLGIRTDNKKVRDRYGNITIRHTKSHRWEHWREEDPGCMLHLSNARRVVLGKAIGRYFTVNTDNSRSEY